MKLVKFSHYVALTQLREVYTLHVAGLNELLTPVLSLLPKVTLQVSTEYYLAYAPVWIPMAREDEFELESLLPKIDEELLDWGLADATAEHEDTTYWHRGYCSQRKDDDDFYLTIGKLNICISLEKECVTIGNNFFLEPKEELNTHEKDADILALVYWMVEILTNEYSSLVKTGDEQYYQEKSVPAEFRFSYMPYADFVKFNHGEDRGINYLFDELSSNEIAQFKTLANNLSTDELTGFKLCKSSYLEIVKQAHIAVGYDAKHLTAVDSYKHYADGRGGGLLSLADNDSAELSHWLCSNEWDGCHPFEIIRGFHSDNRIILEPIYQHNGFILNLYSGGDLSCAAKMIKIALALTRQNVPFLMQEAQKLVGIINGNAMVGIPPIGSSYISTYAFPQTTESNVDIVAIELRDTINALNIPSQLIRSYPMSALFK